MVGSQPSGQDVTVVTASDDADEPRRVDFSLPSDGSPLSPGLPRWANYLKGVIQHYRGKQMTLSTDINSLPRLYHNLVLFFFYLNNCYN